MISSKKWTACCPEEAPLRDYQQTDSYTWLRSMHMLRTFSMCAVFQTKKIRNFVSYGKVSVKPLQVPSLPLIGSYILKMIFELYFDGIKFILSIRKLSRWQTSGNSVSREMGKSWPETANISSLHSADEPQEGRNSCPPLRSYFIGSCHVGVSKRFSRSISFAVYCLY